MESATNSSMHLQPAETTQRKIRKPRATRVSPRSLTQLERSLIVEAFCATSDMDAVAKAFGVPVRTVDSILHAAALRRGPQPERGALGVVARRAA